MKEPIITLDNEMHDRNELTQKAIEDSFYYGYLAKACLSSSAISQLLKSPLEYLNQINLPNESDALAQGYLFHASILEEDKFNECLFIDVATKNNKEYKLAKAERWDVFTVKDRDKALRLRDRFYNCKPASELIENSKFEVPMVNNLLGYPFRGKADVLGEHLIDLKTTQVCSKFKYSANTYNYDSQCYIYCNLFNKSYKDFKYIVIDKSPTNEIGIFNVSEKFYYSGEQKVEYAIKVYENYIKNEYDLENYLTEATL
tara:strand:+ start:17 stop:790 length:774 start_codon:yes stop_codon:yes gene_type:complete